ncbi:MAG: response regulator [Bacillati bacterium ANGP1]|uniref:Response regulator n=1 Tax=Candidatus Segetimicrobium genomatis TaxID=2569760 RepID=A0A537LHB2_9BACT|nr:MAG: response regulator [Terrabacteria group bacterium ANGP1]
MIVAPERVSTKLILLVDDDPVLLQALPEALRLRMEEVNVETCDSAERALQRITEVDYEAIVTDIKMPGTDGLALLAQIKALRPDTPTLLITGHGEHDLAVQALRGGAYDFIQKPIDREYFVASLIRAMQARQYKRQLDDQQHTLERHASDLERTIQERTRELQFLADASRILTASLDSEATLKSIARLAVPRLADMCMTFLAESDGQVRRVEVVHSDPAKEQRLRKLLERYPFNAVVSEPTATVLRTGQALLVPEISEEWARGLGPHTEELSVARTLGSVSLIIVPLVARGRTLGVIAFLTAESNRQYTRDDLALVEELARRAALAIDNARLYEQERRIAETLQRSLLPQRLPPIPGLASAARYLAASPEAVGGDWYDLFVLPRGTVGLVMGDVAGRGVRVAALMAELRSALRAYAVEGYSPAEVVQRLAMLIEPGEMATLVYLIFDPATQTVRFTNAGHPPPLAVAPDGRAAYLEGGAPPLGALRMPSYHEQSAQLWPGSTLLLYTDGLIEVRGASIDDGLARLHRAAAADPNEDLDELVDRVLGEVTRGRPGGDDIALLALRAEIPDPTRFHVRLPAVPSSLPMLRHTLRRWMEAAQTNDEDAYEILVACCEACSNVIEHAYGAADGDVEVRGHMTEHEVEMTVRDWGRWRPPRGMNRGRGLRLIEELMRHVTVTPRPDGTTVHMQRTRRQVTT